MGSLRVLKGMDTALSRLAGHLGSRSLIARAVSLAHADSPWLMTARVPPEDILDHLEERFGTVLPEERFLGEVSVVACLLGLLDTFIGERLTLQLIQEALPELDLQRVELRKEPRP